MISRDRPLLCFVHSTKGDPEEIVPAARALAEAGGDEWTAVDLVQVRGKDLPAADLETLAKVWVEALGSHPATRVVVNDRFDVALASGADGVHLGREDLPAAEVRRRAPEGFLIGVSAHDRRELERAQASDADYAGLGAFYSTRTKAGATRIDAGDPEWRRPVAGLTLPVVAIGGITASRVAAVLAVPAVSGVAVSEAIQAAPEPGRAIRELRTALDQAWRLRRLEGPPEGS